jgi:hypothetical protein
MSHFKIELDPREDKDRQIYYLSKKSGPLILNLKKGVAFLIFTSEDGNEELQIANLDNDTGHYSTFYRKDDRLKIRLDKREDSYGKLFYVAKLKANFNIDCSDISFLAFLSKEGKEELQIVGKIDQSRHERVSKKRKIVPVADSMSKNSETVECPENTVQ